jgi:pimeloyl-ACP methyl ester carboxylesterase
MLAIAALLIALAAGVAYQRLGTRRDRRYLRPPGRLVAVGGHRLHVVCAGAGSPLVLFESGIAASSLSWARVQPAVAAFTRACAYDRAGLAWSESPSGPRTFERIVDELGAVLSEVGSDGRCVLVGHSFGCFIVSAWAARQPAGVAALVLVDPATEWLALTPERARLLRGGRHLSRIGALLANIGVVRACLALLTGGAPAAPRGFVKVFGPTAARTLERLVGEVRKLPAEVHPVVRALWCQPKCFRAMAEHFAALAGAGTALALQRVPPDLPVVVISSGGQPPAQLDAHRAIAAASRAGRHVIAERSAHWVQFDQPELIVEAVRDLVGRT